MYQKIVNGGRNSGPGSRIKNASRSAAMPFHRL